MSTLVDVEREQWILGSLLLEQKLDTLERCQVCLDACNLTQADFSKPSHKKTWVAIETLLRLGKAPDAKSVSELLTAGNPEKASEAVEWLRDLRAKAIVNPAMLRAHANRLRKFSALRKTEAFHRTQLEQITPTADLAELASAATEFGATLAVCTPGSRLASEDCLRIGEEQDAIQAHTREPVIPTGIALLDEYILGFRPTLSIIAGAPGVGKSAILASVLENISNAFAARSSASKVGLFALEDGSEAITSRIVAKHSGIPWGHIGAIALKPEQLVRFQEGLAYAHNVMERVEKFDAPNGVGVTAAQLVSVARDWVLNRNVKIIFIDHLGEIEPEDGDRDKHYRQVRSMAKELRSIAIRYGVPVVCLHHLNREAQRAEQPMLYHLAESDYLGRMCRLALGLWYGASPDTLNVSILKQTRGAAGSIMGSQMLALNRDMEAAMVKSAGGKAIDIGAPK